MIPSDILSRAREHVGTTLHPEAFHGQHISKAFFEGWYVKLVSADRKRRLAVIPGLFLGLESGDEAFVQVLDGDTGKSWYQRYDPAEFIARTDRFDVRVGPNTFSAAGVHLDVPEAGLVGDIAFTTPFIPWPVKPWAPGIMGWYAWMPFLECYHGLVSFDHVLAGSLDLGGEKMDFDGGHGYLEKDWGKGFPSAYVWMQTNHFSTPGTSLSASIAIVPWIRKEFRGFIVGLRHEGELYRFATHTGARTTSLELDDEHVRWSLRSPLGATLDLVAERRRGGLLHAPIRTEMHRRVEETLDSRVHLTLSDRHGAVLLDDTGECAGLEVHGDLDRLVAAR